MRATLRGPWTRLAAALLFLLLAALPWACSGSPEKAGDASAEPGTSGPAGRATTKAAGTKAAKSKDAVAPPRRPPVSPRSAEPAPLEVSEAEPGPDPEPDADPAAGPEPGEAPAVKPPATPGKGEPAISRLWEEEVKEYLKRLSSSREEANEAFRELWEVPRALIPRLILEVTNTSPSALTELKILVLEKRGVARLGEVEGEIHYVIPGMCNFEVDEVAAGPAKSGKGLKVVLRNRKGFSLGVVVRAALMNRFRSSEHPGGDDRIDCLGWWQSFYDRMASRL
jgi:hypothetical protein